MEATQRNHSNEEYTDESFSSELGSSYEAEEIIDEVVNEVRAGRLEILDSGTIGTVERPIKSKRRRVEVSRIIDLGYRHSPLQDDKQLYHFFLVRESLRGKNDIFPASSVIAHTYEEAFQLLKESQPDKWRDAYTKKEIEIMRDDPTIKVNGKDMFAMSLEFYFVCVPLNGVPGVELVNLKKIKGLIYACLTIKSLPPEVSGIIGDILTSTKGTKRKAEDQELYWPNL